MNRKNLPLLLMLTAGAVTCIITYIMDYSVVIKLVSLFLILVLFYFFGSLLKWTLDFFEKQNEEKEEEKRKEAESEGAEEGSEANDERRKTAGNSGETKKES